MMSVARPDGQPARSCLIPQGERDKSPRAQQAGKPCGELRTGSGGLVFHRFEQRVQEHLQLVGSTLGQFQNSLHDVLAFLVLCLEARLVTRLQPGRIDPVDRVVLDVGIEVEGCGVEGILHRIFTQPSPNRRIIEPRPLQGSVETHHRIDHRILDGRPPLNVSQSTDAQAGTDAARPFAVKSFPLQRSSEDLFNLLALGHQLVEDRLILCSRFRTTINVQLDAGVVQQNYVTEIQS